MNNVSINVIQSARRAVLALALGAAVGLGPSAGAMAQNNVLRVVPHSNLTILDPVWTTAYMSRNHGYMIYDTLFGTDENGQVKPQMVDTWTESADHRLWTFKLRKGLEFHDGKPVTGDDVVASLNRWGKRDPMGSALMQFVQRMDSPAPDTFRIFLGEACGFVLQALGRQAGNVPFIMPRRVAETDAFKQITESIGSGPYIFVKDEFKPGDKAVYIRNPKYVPRSEPPSGTTGGKRVYVDRVEWNLALRDAQAQVNALQKGEVDIVEQLPFDHFEAMKADPTVQVPKISQVGTQFIARFNHLQKPFDNVKVRRAAMAAFSQEPFLRAQVGVKSLYKTCAAMFVCGTPFATTAGSDIQAKGSMKQAQELLKASGYDGTPVVIMKPTDLAAIQKLPDVAAQLLRQAGFKVDLQALDWQSLVARRAKKEPIDKGGWSIFITGFLAMDMWSPISNTAIDARGEQAWFGWAKDDKLVDLRNQFMRATDAPTQKRLAEAVQVRAYEIATHAPLGESDVPMGARKAVSGFFVSNVYAYWNLKKN
jgi:peptide/nickel transport system substrate-binding protein